MSSSKEDGTAAAAADQLGSMSLGESAERNENNEDAAEENEASAKMCSACGEKSDTTKKCTACKCVNYCDRECQNKHWKEHKNECKRIKKILGKRGGKLDIGTEKDLGPLRKLPPRAECPICMHPLPLHDSLHTYVTCCGKIICCGCFCRHHMESGEWVVEGDQQTLVPQTCPFCRSAIAEEPGEEGLSRLRKRVQHKDAYAIRNLALCYESGSDGLPVDQAKCVDLMRQSGDLGCLDALYQLGMYYHHGKMGLEKKEGEALKYWKKAAELGDLHAQHNLGYAEGNSGDTAAAMHHFRLSASGGLKISTECLLRCFEDGALRHGDLAETLQAFYRARAELKSTDRDKYISLLKKYGKDHGREYRAEYEC